MDLTLDKFKEHFWNIAAVIAVVITIFIGVSFIIQIRESSGIIFGKLPKTQIQGDVFSNEFEFRLENNKIPGVTKLPRLAISEGFLEKAKFLAKVFKIAGKANSRKDITGNTYVNISDKGGSLTYNMGDSSWEYTGEFSSKKSKSISSASEAEEISNGVLRRLNLDSELNLVNTVTYEIIGLGLEVTEDEKRADEFVLEYTSNYADRNSYQTPFNPTTLVGINKSGLVTRVSHKPVSIVESEVGNYPIVNIGGIKKRVESGKGIVPIIGLRSDVLNSKEVGKVIFTEIELSYIADEKNNLLVPFWIIKGYPEEIGQSKNVIVLVNAIVDKYLKE